MNQENNNGRKELEIILKKQDPSKLLSSRFVADFLDISMQTLYRLCKKHLIDYVKSERNVRFEVQAVLKYIETFRVTAQ